MAGERKLTEIDESELLSLRGVHQVVASMLANPESRKLVLQARKISDPNAPIPEIDAQTQISSAVNEVKAEFAKWREDQKKAEEERATQEAQRQFQAAWDQAKDRLRADGWRDDGLAEVEKHAKERGIADLEAAAAHYEKLHPPSEPVTPNGFGSWDFFQPPSGETETYVDKLMAARGEDEGALRQETGRALNDFRASVVNRR